MYREVVWLITEKYLEIVMWSNIIKFPDERVKRSPSAHKSERSKDAQILFFTGIRYERQHDKKTCELGSMSSKNIK